MRQEGYDTDIFRKAACVVHSSPKEYELVLIVTEYMPVSRLEFALFADGVLFSLDFFLTMSVPPFLHDARVSTQYETIDEVVTKLHALPSVRRFAVEKTRLDEEEMRNWGSLLDNLVKGYRESIVDKTRDLVKKIYERTLMSDEFKEARLRLLSKE
ncbi:MAG: hypothetical protein V1743_01155 [Nanoarchaeota archaeon]